jgi:sugar (pentulose or hexulose) kinase
MFLGIELGSTRIKGIVLDASFKTIASGSYIWKTELKDGYWTYDLNEVWLAMREIVAKISQQIDLRNIQALGISAMMHGFLPFDEHEQLLTPFRTWKNVNTEVAAGQLSNLFNFNVPLRWSIAHYHQAWHDKEDYVEDIANFTTLAGYVHRVLTGRNVLGIGDASGMFPIDVTTKDYNQSMIDQYRKMTGIDVRPLLPVIVAVGGDAGCLSEEGAKTLDPSGRLQAGLPFAPPEGDAQTGMVSTNALKPKTGNVSAGTSVFSMIVLQHSLKTYYPQIDIVQTPLGDAVAMVHANECTSRIDPWIELFGEVLTQFGNQVDRDKLFEDMYEIALNDNSSLGRFMKDKLVSAIIDLQEGMDILTKQEQVAIDYLKGHGGYFKSKSAGAIIMEKTLGIPIKLLDNAGEGGPWGMAVLAAYRFNRLTSDIRLDEFMRQVFKGE